MIGPSLPNPFDHSLSDAGHLSSGGLPQGVLDTAIAQALRSEPLVSPPPLLYAAVMRSVRREPRPRFRLNWLDLALSLFAAGMLLVAWWAVRSLPALWLDYLRLVTLYQVQKLWYLNFPLLVWSAAALGLLLTCGAVAALLRSQIRFQVGP